jgi:hypothetical protein
MAPPRTASSSAFARSSRSKPPERALGYLKLPNGRTPIGQSDRSPDDQRAVPPTMASCGLKSSTREMRQVVSGAYLGLAPPLPISSAPLGQRRNEGCREPSVGGIERLRVEHKERGGEVFQDLVRSRPNLRPASGLDRER